MLVDLLRVGNEGGRHACYLSYQNEHEIRYADANIGVYCFKNKNEFIKFYVSAATLYLQQGKHYEYFSISEMRYDKESRLKPSNTLAGKIRSLLVGKKYPEGFSWPFFAELFLGVLAFAICVGAGAIVGGGVASLLAFPAIGLAVSVVAGAAAGTLAGLAILAVGAQISLDAKKQSLDGLLGPLQYIQHKVYHWFYNPEIKKEHATLQTAQPKKSDGAIHPKGEKKQASEKIEEEPIVFPSPFQTVKKPVQKENRADEDLSSSFKY